MNRSSTMSPLIDPTIQRSDSSSLHGTGEGPAIGQEVPFGPARRQLDGEVVGRDGISTSAGPSQQVCTTGMEGLVVARAAQGRWRRARRDRRRARPARRRRRHGSGRRRDLVGGPGAGRRARRSVTSRWRTPSAHRRARRRWPPGSGRARDGSGAGRPEPGRGPRRFGPGPRAHGPGVTDGRATRRRARRAGRRASVSRSRARRPSASGSSGMRSTSTRARRIASSDRSVRSRSPRDDA